jgi:HD superfamily phosphodiesterase
VRLGNPQAEPPDRRSEAVDLVDSLGELYERALSRRDALTLHLEGLRRALSSRTGLRGEALDKRMEALAGGAAAALEAQGEMTPAAFARTLATVNDGYRRLEEHVVPR